jgi:CHAT domain-containing protein/Tfp pilus assembly protein PilF
VETGVRGYRMRRFELICFVLILLVGAAWGQTAEEVDELKTRAKALYEKRDYKQALPLAEQAFKASLAIHGEENATTSYCAWVLADTYEALGDYSSAERYYKLCIDIDERVQGPEHPETAISLNNLALLYNSMGDYKKALPLNQRALAIREKSLGPEHPDTAQSLIGLAQLLSSTGEYQQALPLFQRALAIFQKAFGPEHPNTVSGLNSLAILYTSMGDYQQAMSRFKRALAIREKVLGLEHRDTTTSLNNLAALYVSMEDYQQALPLLQQALAITEKVLGPDHTATATNLNNLAFLYNSMGNDQEALPLYQRALAIREEAFGPEHPDTAASLGNLAALYISIGDYQQALPLCQRALVIQEKALGPEHRDTATSLNNLAFLYKSMGDYQQALPLNQRALIIREKALGPEHPDTAQSLNNLAVLQIELDSTPEALTLAERKAASTLATTANIFTFASERQRLAYQEKQLPFDLFGTLQSAPNLARQALRYKGLVLDSVVEDLRLAEASDDPATRELAGQVKSVKSQLNQLVFNTPADLDGEAREKRAQREAELRKQLENFQSQLARQGVEQGNLRRAFTITPKQVQEALPPNSVLVEFLRYSHYLGKNEKEARYGAVLLPKEGEPVWAPLPGKADDLETLVSSYKKLVRGQDFTRQVVLEIIESDDDQIAASQLLIELYEKIWAPLEKALPPGTKTVVLSPDGELNFLSFATLITPNDTFLAQEYTLTYVSSGRDLVADLSNSTNQQRLLVGDPAFGSEVKAKENRSALSRAVDTRDWRGLSFAPLPYTRAECQGLQKFFTEQEQQVEVLLNEEATEARIRSVQSPQTLHLATHGYFLPEPEGAREEAKKPGKKDLNRPLKDPMYRSGLALAGAQTTVGLRASGKNPDIANDGLLTAAEVGILDLKGTRLVTLSACDTGSGESRAGEGVLGLRRGFVQAGARNLIMTLWPVADKETSELMQDFYARADSLPAPLAMAEVQREWLTRLREEKSLSEAVRLAGPFVLSFQGSLE